MNRCKTLVRIAPLVVLFTASLAWSQTALVKGSFTLPTEARWGQLALVPGNYSFVIRHSMMAPAPVELSRDGQFVGYILAAANDDHRSNESSLLLQKWGDGYAVKELRVGEAGLFSYSVPKARMTRLAQDSTTIPVRASGK